MPKRESMQEREYFVLVLINIWLRLFSHHCQICQSIVCSFVRSFVCSVAVRLCVVRKVSIQLLVHRHIVHKYMCTYNKVIERKGLLGVFFQFQSSICDANDNNCMSCSLSPYKMHLNLCVCSWMWWINFRYEKCIAKYRLQCNRVAGINGRFQSKYEYIYFDIVERNAIGFQPNRTLEAHDFKSALFCFSFENMILFSLSSGLNEEQQHFSRQKMHLIFYSR